MSNALIRSGSSYVVAGSPYVPAQPAYSYYRTYLARRSGPINTTRGAWVTRIDGDTGRQTTQWEPNFPVSLPTTEYYEASELVFVPAKPEQAGVAPRIVDVPPRGWNSFARSAVSLGATGEAKFKVGAVVTGVAVGLAHFSNPTEGYGHINHGMVFTDSKVFNIRTGALISTYTDTDEFAVRVKAGTVTLKKNGATLTTESSTYGTGPLYLSSVLYGAHDEVFDPVLTPLYGGNATLTIPLATLQAYEDVYATGRVEIPVATMSGGSLRNSGRLTIPMASMFASDDTGYAQGYLTIPMATMSSLTGAIVPVDRPGGQVLIPMAAVVGHGLTGQIGNGTLTVPMASMRGADHPYGEGYCEIPMAYVLSSEESDQDAYLLEIVGSNAPLRSTVEAVVLMLAGVGVVATKVPTTVLDALMHDTVGVDVSWAMTALLDAVMRSSVWAGSTRDAAYAGDGEETWVMNLATQGNTSYSNYAFNSYAKVFGRYYGANRSGLYALDGDTDDGAPIRASLSLGQLDFGTATLKTVKQAYLGMSASGNLFVKVIGEDGESYIYKTRSFSESLKQQRVTFGKGLRTSYVQLEIYNESGDDFELDTVEFHVADLSRRI